MICSSSIIFIKFFLCSIFSMHCGNKKECFQLSEIESHNCTYGRSCCISSRWEQLLNYRYIVHITYLLCTWCLSHCIVFVNIFLRTYSDVSCNITHADRDFFGYVCLSFMAHNCYGLVCLFFWVNCPLSEFFLEIFWQTNFLISWNPTAVSKSVHTSL